MKLFFSPTSPYTRKVRIVAILKGFGDRLELVPTNPFEDPAGLTAANPLARVPTLEADDGLALYDSRVICDYLDATGSGPRLIPRDGPARWKAMRAEAMADGVLDNAFSAVMETMRRPENERSPDWVKRWMTGINRAVGTLDGNLADWREPLSLGSIAVACMLGYLDFRLKEQVDWRAAAPATADWYAGFAKRPEMTETAPPG